MCKEGIRVGRNTEAIGVTFDGQSPAGTQVIGADADRVALTFGPASINPFGGIEAFTIGPRVGGRLVPLLSIARSHPIDRVTIEQVGSVILQEMYVIQSTVGVFTGGIVSTRLRQSLESI